MWGTKYKHKSHKIKYFSAGAGLRRKFKALGAGQLIEEKGKANRNLKAIWGLQIVPID